MAFLSDYHLWVRKCDWDFCLSYQWFGQETSSVIAVMAASVGLPVACCIIFWPDSHDVCIFPICLQSCTNIHRLRHLKAQRFLIHARDLRFLVLLRQFLQCALANTLLMRFTRLLSVFCVCVCCQSFHN